MRYHANALQSSRGGAVPVVQLHALAATSQGYPGMGYPIPAVSCCIHFCRRRPCPHPVLPTYPRNFHMGGVLLMFHFSCDKAYISYTLIKR